MTSSLIRATSAILLDLSILAIAPLGALWHGSNSTGSHSGRSSSRASASRSSKHMSGHSHSAVKRTSCPHDSHGKIQRDPNAGAEFERSHLRPSDCKDCKVDHIIPLSKGGSE